MDGFADYIYKIDFIDLETKMWFNNRKVFLEDDIMERIKTLETKNLCESAKTGGCGECQTSCQSACKTSCGVANQPCENTRQ